jgi:hypothetical protein
MSIIQSALVVIGIYAICSHLYFQITSAWMQLNVTCMLTGFTCGDQTNTSVSELETAWNSGEVVLKTSERVLKMTRMMGIRTSSTVNVTELAWVSLPGNLERMALSVGDYIAHYHRDAPSSTEQTEWNEFASQCWKWRHELTQVARDAYTVQLGIRTVAIKGLAVLQLLNETWIESSAQSREHLLLELQALRKHIATLSSTVRRVDGRMLEQEQTGSTLITTAIGKVQMTDLEIANRAQTWSWPTTLLIYGVATAVGGATSAVMPISAPVVVAGIAHFVNSQKNEDYKKQLRTQNVMYTQAGAVLTDARTVLMQMDKELLEFADDLSRCEESVLIAIGRVDSATRDNRTRTAVQVAISAAIKELQDLHSHSQRAVSAYTGQSSNSQQQHLTLPDGR